MHSFLELATVTMFSREWKNVQYGLSSGISFVFCGISFNVKVYFILVALPVFFVAWLLLSYYCFLIPFVCGSYSLI